jgi:hypothetical protein
MKEFGRIKKYLQNMFSTDFLWKMFNRSAL